MNEESPGIEITAVISTRNRRETFLETLGSVLDVARKDPGGWELVVVDNGSSDGTAEAARKTAEGAPIPVRVVTEPEMGASSARNRGLRESRGDVTVFLDDDITLREDWITRLRERVREAPGAAAFGGRIVAQWSEPPPAWLPMEGPYRVQAGAYVAHDWGEEVYEYEETSIMPLTANAAVRRWAWKKYGGFRTDLDRKGKELLSGGDTEFYRRLVRAGERVQYLPDVVVYHPALPERLTRRYMRRWHFHMGRSMVRMDGIPPGSIRWGGVPRYMFRELGESLARWLLAGLAFRRDRRFFYELDICRILGRIRESRTGVEPQPPPRAEDPVRGSA
jgi:glycosyltransferase involved in cell wall biosynthesis